MILLEKMRLNKILQLGCLAFSLSLFTMANAQERKDPKDVDLDKMLTEIQFSSDNPDYIEMIWWLPYEFWEVSNSQDPTTSAEETEEMKKIMSHYLIAAVVKGKIGYFGGIDYVPLEDLREKISVRYQGENLQILDENDLPPDLKNFTLILQPMLSNMFGTMGENMHFLVFDNPKGKDVLPANPYGGESLEFELEDFNVTTDLPLSSLILEKVCPNDNALLNGKFSYCPYHGVKLISQ